MLSGTFVYTPANNIFKGVHRNHPVICRPIFLVFTTLILMKLYTVAVYNLKMCMIEDKSDLKKISREIILERLLFVWDWGCPL